MSTYGTAIIADVADEAAARRILPQLEAALEPLYADISSIVPNPAAEAEPAISTHGNQVRMSVYLPTAAVDDLAHQAFHAVGPGRAVVAEDADEYGVVFSVWKLTTGDPQQVYRTHVTGDSNPELVPDNLRQGAQAATEAAALYDADPQAILDIENDPTPVADNLGTIGDPFSPWLDALGLAWPDSRE
ncbi:hypothetical protein HUN08_03085 [Gordonia sp. X0973]|uniref:hypothetical protein n=1 Tax=Gordonia sp. X0973 TaxID=2742602 RepID=UPI000F53723F|nr:hypothetical protein [Gordonia sp. X0973]QKT06295.1 hypothetical protein HUN08_03085 [Gordonia sp. X0973]